MRLSISNIAWELAAEDAVAAILREHGVQLVDIAPGKYFSNPEEVSSAEIEAVRRLWSDRGFRIEGMQALLFGTAGLNMFADGDGAMFRRLAAVIRLGGRLGARALTFGSPRQRDRTKLPDDAVSRIALDFFRRLGDVAVEADVLFCLEPNPEMYACNFMTTTAEAASVVELIDHPGVRLQIDLGAMTINREPVAETIERYGSLAGHVHASEPKLAVLSDHSTHDAAAAALSRIRPDLAVTIEMTTSSAESALDSVKTALLLAQTTYGLNRSAQ